MLNIQLFFEGQEVELNKNISFPLNKMFEHLWNPTDIIVEHSKSINIPATKINNKLMMNAYRIDRQFVVNEDNPNIGMYLDPLKRIPMKLIYNGSILLEGYAKYTSATVNSKETYYTFNLYGVLGDVFQTLMDCVVDENKLTDEQKNESDGGKRYVIECPWEKSIINKDFVKGSWAKYSPSPNSTTDPFDYIGMAPAYRGLYSEFSSNSVYALYTLKPGDTNTKATSVEEQLKERWKYNLINSYNYTEEQAQSHVDSIDFDMIIPNGLSEHNMRQFRSYEQKPYIYIKGLFDMFSKKCTELTGYNINLDKNWFNVNNPYWSQLCYMLDYLSTRGVNNEATSKFTDPMSGQFVTNGTQNTYNVTGRSFTITDFGDDVLNASRIKIAPFDVGVSVVREADRFDSLLPFGDPPINTYLGMSPAAHLAVTISIRNSMGDVKTVKYWGHGDEINVVPISSDYTSDNYRRTTTLVNYKMEDGKRMLTGTTTIPIPSIDLGMFDTDGLRLHVLVQICTPPNGSEIVKAYYNPFLYRYRDVHNGFINYTGIPVSVNDPDYNVSIQETNIYSNWRTTTTCELKNLYTKEEPLFNILLQYTKMFGLIWKTDYNNKTIDIMSRQTYFKDYNVVDWTDKIDKSKGMTIEPVSFNSKYVTFNYDNTDGFRYTGYRNKYGVNYGEKKLKTKYNFDVKEENLFKEKIGASSVSCKSFVTIDDLKVWDTVTTLPSTQSEINFIDCENNETTQSININNYYFRCPNKTVKGTYIISDVSEQELINGSYYWYGNSVIPSSIAVTTQSLPQFSPVFKDELSNDVYGCLFNCPNEDYTYDDSMAEANGNYIYDLCWGDYINERYNANNKKLTCYVRLTPIEFEQFNFKTFITIDNQLFVVNKIVDYDINSNTTKCEFIQVSNISGYTEQKGKYPEIIYEKNEVRVSTSSVGGTISAASKIKVKCWPQLSDIATFTVNPITVGSQQSTCRVSSSYSGNYITTLSLNYRSDGTYTEEWELDITFNDGENKKIPIYING